jgi:hypothetical protein
MKKILPNEFLASSFGWGRLDTKILFKLIVSMT